jgi:Spy/CpxP family protein refolding chaperone
MRIYLKTAVAVLAMAIAGIPGFAGTSPQDPDPMPNPDDMGPHGQMMRQMRTGALQDCPMMSEMGPGGPQDRGMGMHGPGMGNRGFGLGRLLNDPDVRQQLGISPEQAAKIKQQQSDFRKAEVRNRADLEIKRMDLHDLVSAEKPDRSAIDRKLQEVGAAQLALEKSAIDHRLTMREMLTPEQRQKLQQMMRREPQPPTPMRGGSAPHGMQGGGRGGRGTVPMTNPQGQAPPNQ